MIALRQAEGIDISRLEMALKYQDELTVVMVLQRIAEGFYVLLRAPQSTVTIHLMDDAVHVAQMSGKMADIQAIHDCLVKIAKDLGKPYITVRGRKGWNKVLKPLGFEPGEYYLRKSI